MFDWQSFLERQGIDFATSGPSTSKDNLYVHCPFCGEADQGHHMGISIKGKGWGCWREQSHRGRNPARLIQALTGCSWEEANRTAGGRKLLSGAGAGLLGAVQGLLGKREDADSRGKLELPKNFRRLCSGKNIHYRYMRDRGFSKEAVETLVEQFDIRVCPPGDKLWSWRIILPVYDMDLELQTWTARALGDANVRYRTLTADPDKIVDGKLARGPITDYLLNAEKVGSGGEFLVLAEGPFDALNLSLSVHRYGAQASCLFGKAISASQMDTLAMLRPYYKKVFLLLDPDAATAAMRMSSQLQALNVKLVLLKGSDDPGDMGPVKLHKLLGSMADRV